MFNLHFRLPGIFAFCCFFVSCLNSHADSFKTKEWVYDTKKSNLIPGYTAKLIAEGMLIGQYTDQVQDLPQTRGEEKGGAPSKPSLQEQFAQLIKKQTAQTNSYSSLSDVKLDDSPQAASEEAASEVLTEQPMTAVHASLGSGASGLGRGEFNSRLFFECTQAQTKKLKELLVLEEKRNQMHGLPLMQLIQQLSHLQSDMNQTRLIRPLFTLPQLVCSLHLGKAAFPVSTVLDEIKILSSLSARKNESTLKSLLKIAWVAYHPSVILHSRLLPVIYQQMWQELSLFVSFQREALPSIEQLTQHLYERYQGEPDGLIDHLSQAALAREVRQGQTLFEQAWLGR